MLRIFFTGEDLARVRVARDPDTTWQSVLRLFGSHPRPGSVRSCWAYVQAHVDAERAKRAKILLDGGSEALLSSYRPLMRWSHPVLELDVRADQDVQLDGRGLLLVPSFLTLAVAGSPPRVRYPMEHDRVPVTADRGLEALLGTTRSYVLGEINDGATTSELARRIGVSRGLVSRHTAVLRGAGLVRTTRAGKSVLHTLTPLGAALLAGPRA